MHEGRENKQKYIVVAICLLLKMHKQFYLKLFRLKILCFGGFVWNLNKLNAHNICDLTIRILILL